MKSTIKAALAGLVTSTAMLSAAAAEDIKVGLLLPYSGVYAALGQDIDDAFALGLVTFGLIFVALDATRLVWGDLPIGIAVPAVFEGQLALAGIEYPIYRLFIIALGLGVMAVLTQILTRSQIGAMIRAGVDNDQMAACLGINVERMFFLVFVVGCALAGPAFRARPA